MNKFLRSIGLLFILLTYGPAYAAIDEDELLEPEKAFATTASIDDNNRISVEIKIADGYYLYRNKIKFASKTQGIEIAALSSPPGKTKEDEFFGTIETYRKNVTVSSDISAATGMRQLELEVTSQGCADLGICYPPMTLPFTLALNEINVKFLSV